MQEILESPVLLAEVVPQPLGAHVSLHFMFDSFTFGGFIEITFLSMNSWNNISISCTNT